jgi:protein required for attachment to host cells
LDRQRRTACLPAKLTIEEKFAMNTWILVGDASRARVFAHDANGKPWAMVRELEHPESRARNADLKEGTAGRVQQSAGQGHRPAMESTAPKDYEAERFAIELASVLDHEFDARAFESLVLVAPPQFLGMLRKRLSAKLAKVTAATLDKDYTALPAREIQPLVEDALRSAVRP